jgi:hypothetical protein
MAASSGVWYSKVSKKATRKTLRLWTGKGLRCLFREYLSYTMGVGVVRGGSAVGVPLWRLFRYERMDVRVMPLSQSKEARACRKLRPS